MYVYMCVCVYIYIYIYIHDTLHTCVVEFEGGFLTRSMV